LYNHERKFRQDVHAAVLDLSVGQKDLQQCADAVMRLRAEYLFGTGKMDSIHFRYTNGFEARFGRWRAGDRIRVQGNTCTWLKAAAAPDSSHANLLRFLEKVFMYAGTRSLAGELRPVAKGNAPVAGDVMIHGGAPGHAMLVLDVAADAKGRHFALLAQSYMPAQQMHVVRNAEQPALGNWYEWGAGSYLRTPEWTFAWEERGRWP
jgi:hypothetical protein